MYEMTRIMCKIIPTTIAGEQMDISNTELTLRQISQ